MTVCLSLFVSTVFNSLLDKWVVLSESFPLETSEWLSTDGRGLSTQLVLLQLLAKTLHKFQVCFAYYVCTMYLSSSFYDSLRSSLEFRIHCTSLMSVFELLATAVCKSYHKFLILIFVDFCVSVPNCYNILQ